MGKQSVPRRLGRTKQWGPLVGECLPWYVHGRSPRSYAVPAGQVGLYDWHTPSDVVEASTTTNCCEVHTVEVLQLGWFARLWKVPATE